MPSPQASPAYPSLELQFPPETMTDNRSGHLARQAFVLEYASFLAADYTEHLQNDEAATIAAQIPGLATYRPRTFFPNTEIDLSETQITLSAFFNARIRDGIQDTNTFAGFHKGLISFEDPSLNDAIMQNLYIIKDLRQAQIIKLPNFINSGYFINAFLVEPSGHPRSVLKVDKSMFDTSPDIQRIAASNMRRWLGLIAGTGVAGLEQPVAFSAEANVTVSAYAPGESLMEILDKGDIPAPTDSQQLVLAEAVASSIARGIDLDINRTNVLYDEKAGFTIIDYDACATSMRNNPRSFIDRIDDLLRNIFYTFGDNIDRTAFSDVMHDATQPVLQQMRS